MGLLRTLLPVMMDMYGQGMLGGQPGRIKDLQEQGLRQASLGAAQEGEAIRKKGAALDKPMWTQGKKTIGGEAWDPAAGGDIGPPQPNPQYKEGMSIRQFQQMAEGAANMPIKTLISTKTGGKMMEPFLEMILGPEATAKATGPGMYRSPEGIKAEEYGIAAAKEGADDPDFAPKLERLFGIREKTPAPTVGSGAVGTYKQKGFPSGELGGVVTEAPEKEGAKATSVKEYETWKATDPKQAGKSYGEYITWKASTVAETKAKAIFGDLNKEKRMALDMAKVALSQWIDSQPFGAVEMNEDQSLTMLMELYQKALTKVTTGKTTPKPEVGGHVDPKFERKEGERLDVKSIQKAIDAQKAKKR